MIYRAAQLPPKGCAVGRFRRKATRGLSIKNLLRGSWV